jgi:hypothetical protein
MEFLLLLYLFRSKILRLKKKVDIESHVGFRGGLSGEECDTAAYYADRHIEVILHCPYLSRIDFLEQSLAVSEPRPVSALPPQIDMIPQVLIDENSMLLATHELGGLSEPGSFKKESHILSGRSSMVDSDKKSNQQDATGAAANTLHTNAAATNTSAHNTNATSKSNHSKASHPKKSFAEAVAGDLVYVIWIENLDQVHILAKKILAFFHPKSHTHHNHPHPHSQPNQQQQQSQQQRLTSPAAAANPIGPFVFIFVHPLPHTPSLYLIRLLMIGAEQSHDIPPFGPLSDGVIISRHSLVLVKNTAIAALHYLKGLRHNNKKPYEKRMHHLEEICNRHKQKNLGLANFYSHLFL